MRIARAALATWALIALASGPGGASAATAPPAPVTAVELASPHRLPETIVRAAIGDLAGRPLSRAAVRESLDRLWALGLFSRIGVEQVAEPGGLRLRYHLERLPHVTRVSWAGNLGLGLLPDILGGLDRADLAGAAGLAVGESATADRLEGARQALQGLYRQQGFVGATVEVRTREDRETNGRDVTFVVEAGERARVGTVELVGLAQAPAEALTRALGVRAGDRYREAKVRDGVQAVGDRLRELGFFEARVALGEPGWDRATHRVALRVTVSEGPRTRVEFEGNAAVKEPVLRERLTFPDSRVVDELEVQASARELEQAYRDEGYHFVGVEGSLTAEDTNRLVRFRITEGPRVRVESVTFTGATTVPVQRLRAQMESRPPEFLHGGLFRQHALDRDLRVLLGFLQRLGFRDAEVGPAEVRFSPDRQRAGITIPVAEGPRFTVGALAVAGQTRLTRAEVMAAIPLGPGEPWDPARAEEGRRVIERRYARLGYHGARVELSTTTREHTVDATYRVTEGEPTRIGRLLVRGLVVTREPVVLRELPFRPGSLLDPDELTAAQQRLVATRLFERVEVEPLRPPATPFADVELTLREAKPWRLDFGLGYSTEERARGFLEVGHDNLFGTGRSASLRGRASQRGHRFALAVREPWLLGTRWEGEASLFSEAREEIGFQLERRGASARLQRDLELRALPGLRGSLRYRIEDVNRFDVDPALATQAVEPGRQRVASLTPSLALDRRDQPLDPRRGSLHLVSLEGGGVPLGGEVDFLKLRLETHWFLDWLPPTVLALSARVGLATPLGDTPALAIEDRFVAGGSTTVRGYRENRLGPRDEAGNPLGGNGQVIVNVEWRFPIWRWLGGALFLDAGAITREVREMSLGEFRAGTGAGIRIATPIGPIRLDAAYALQPIGSDRRVRLYLTVGHPF